MFTHDIIFRGRECGEERRGRERGEERGRGDSREQSEATNHGREKRTLGPLFRGPQAQDLEFRSPSPSPWRWGGWSRSLPWGAERPHRCVPDHCRGRGGGGSPWAWLDPVRPAGRAKGGVRGDCWEGGGPGADPTGPCSSRLPGPTVCSQSKRSPSHPGGAPRRLPPSIVPDNFIQRGACCGHEAQCAGRSEARGQRSSLAEALGGTWTRRGDHPLPHPPSLGALALGRRVLRPLRPCCLSVGPWKRSPSVPVC